MVFTNLVFYGAFSDLSRGLWWGEHFRCDNARCGFEGAGDYIGALNVARVLFSETDELD